MKRFSILVLCLFVFRVQAADVAISDLTIIASPSTNTFLEVSDMDASPKSRKYLLTNLVTKAIADAGYVAKAGDTMSGSLRFSGTSTLLGTPSLTTAQKNALTPSAGDIVYDSDLGRVQVYDGAAWHSRVRLDGDTMTGVLLMPSGSVGAPSLSFSGDSDTGFYNQSANRIGISLGNTLEALLIQSELRLKSSEQITWSSGVPSAAAGDTYIVRDSANTVQLGADAATATAQTIKAHDGSGTDKDGASLTLEGGQSSGTGRGGGVVLRTSGTSATGSSANAYQDRFRAVPKYVELTDNTATTLFTVTLPTTNTIGMSFTCTVQASDGTDFQSLTTQVTVDAVAKSTTITAVVAPTAAQTALAGSAGTLSVTYTIVDAGSNVLAVKATADTSLTPTYLRAKIVMTGINGMGAGWSITEI